MSRRSQYKYLVWDIEDQTLSGGEDLVYVYELRHFDGSLPFYVGMTKAPVRRLRQHISGQCCKNERLGEYIKSMMARGDTPRLSVIAICSSFYARHVERAMLDWNRLNGFAQCNIEGEKRPRRPMSIEGGVAA